MSSELYFEQLLLDLRSAGEIEKFSTREGAIHIPAGELRQRIGELPKDKTIIVFCAVGLQGHVVYCQLVNRGYKARNLLCGYRTYNFAKV